MDHEGLHAHDAGVGHAVQLGGVARDQPAPEGGVGVEQAVDRGQLLRQRGCQGHRVAVQGHVDDGGDAPGEGGPGGGLEALPLGAPRLVDVHVAKEVRRLKEAFKLAQKASRAGAAERRSESKYARPKPEKSKACGCGAAACASSSADEACAPCLGEASGSAAGGGDAAAAGGDAAAAGDDDVDDELDLYEAMLAEERREAMLAEAPTPPTADGAVPPAAEGSTDYRPRGIKWATTKAELDFRSYAVQFIGWLYERGVNQKEACKAAAVASTS